MIATTFGFSFHLVTPTCTRSKVKEKVAVNRRGLGYFILLGVEPVPA